MDEDDLDELLDEVERTLCRKVSFASEGARGEGSGGSGQGSWGSGQVKAPDTHTCHINQRCISTLADALNLGEENAK